MRTSIERGYPTKFRASGLLFWARADLGITIATGVSAWADLSGAGNNHVQATTTKQPTFAATGGPRSRPCVTFDGVDDFLAVTFTQIQPITRCTVGIFRAAFVAVDTLCDGNGGANRGRISRTQNTTIQVNPGGMAGTLATTTSWHVYALIMNGASSSWRADNVQIAAGDASGNVNVGGSVQGAFGTGTGSWGNVSISEDMMFATIFTESLLARLTHYCGAQYALLA
jgi:hypothetical protein